MFKLLIQTKQMLAKIKEQNEDSNMLQYRFWAPSSAELYYVKSIKYGTESDFD